jgi:hypothetical protein
MKHHRRRARKNPTGLDWLMILGGAAAVGLTVYFVTKPAAAATTTPTTGTAGPPQLPKF